MVESKTSWWRERSRFFRVTTIFVGVLLVALLALWLALPAIVASVMRDRFEELEEETGVAITFEDVSVSGLSELTVSGLKAVDEEGELLGALGSVHVEATGVLFGDLVVKRVELTEPMMRVHYFDDGTTNLSRVAERMPEREREGERDVTLELLSVRGASVELSGAIPESVPLRAVHGLDLEFRPDSASGGSLEAALTARLQLSADRPELETTLTLSGVYDAANMTVDAAVGFPTPPTLPLNGDGLIPGARLDGLSLQMSADPEAPLEASRLSLHYQVVGMPAQRGYSLMETDWAELVVFGKLPPKPAPGAEELDAYAEPGVKRWTESPGSLTLTTDDLKPALSTTETYIERFELQVLPESGVKLEMGISLSNFGPGSHKGSIAGTLTWSDGSEYTFFERVGSDWELSEEGYTLRMGNWTLTGELGKLTLSGEARAEDAKDGEAPPRIQVTFTGASWKPGVGLALMGDGEQGAFLEDTLAVVGKAEGTVTRGDEELPLSGHGYAHRTGSNVGSQGLSERVYRFFRIEGPIYMEFKRIQTTDVVDRKPIDYLVVFYEGERVYEAYDVEMSEQELHEDTTPGNYGYSVPKRIDLVARDAEGRVAKVAITASDVDAFNPLAELSPFLRAMAEKLAKPTQFKMPSTWALSLPDGLGVPTSHRGECTTTCFVMR